MRGEVLAVGFGTGLGLLGRAEAVVVVLVVVSAWCSLAAAPVRSCGSDDEGK